MCLNKYVTFSGRASRSEYWYFFLFCVLLLLATTVVDMVIFGVGNKVSPITALTQLALLLPYLAVGVRRLHDTNRSGWWIGGYWLGLVGFFILFLYLSQFWSMQILLQMSMRSFCSSQCPPGSCLWSTGLSCWFSSVSGATLAKTVLAELGVTRCGYQAAASALSPSRSAFTSAKLRPSPSRIAALPVLACQRSTATST